MSLSLFKLLGQETEKKDEDKWGGTETRVRSLEEGRNPTMSHLRSPQVYPVCRVLLAILEATVCTFCREAPAIVTRSSLQVLGQSQCSDTCQCRVCAFSTPFSWNDKNNLHFLIDEPVY